MKSTTQQRTIKNRRIGLKPHLDMVVEAARPQIDIVLTLEELEAYFDAQDERREEGRP